jgi:hypothetical protein
MVDPVMTKRLLPATMAEVHNAVAATPGHSGAQISENLAVNTISPLLLIAGASNDTEREVLRGDARNLHRHATRNKI